MTNFFVYFWWFSFFVLAILLQALCPGLDALVGALLLVLKNRDYRALFWLLPLLIILQEGMGTRIFGTIVLWYVAVILIFWVGRWMFESNRLTFVLLLSICLGGAYFGIAWLITPLDANVSMGFDVESMLRISAIETGYIPIIWWICSKTYPVTNN